MTNINYKIPLQYSEIGLQELGCVRVHDEQQKFR